MDNMIDCMNNASDEDCFKCMKDYKRKHCNSLCEGYRRHRSGIEEQMLYEKAIKTYGQDMQVNVAMEEMAELIQALVKYRRSKSEKNLAHIWEEIADVQIMINQLKIIYDGEEKVLEQIARKQRRLEERLSESK